MVLRAEDISGSDLSGSSVLTWRPVCSCGTVSNSMTTVSAAKPQLVTSGAFPYVDAGAGDLVPCQMNIGSEYTPFAFESSTGGLHAHAVIRLHTTQHGNRAHVVRTTQLAQSNFSWQLLPCTLAAWLLTFGAGRWTWVSTPVATASHCQLDSDPLCGPWVLATVSSTTAEGFAAPCHSFVIDNATVHLVTCVCVCGCVCVWLCVCGCVWLRVCGARVGCNCNTGPLPRERVPAGEWMVVTCVWHFGTTRATSYAELRVNGDTIMTTQLLKAPYSDPMEYVSELTSSILGTYSFTIFGVAKTVTGDGRQFDGDVRDVSTLSVAGVVVGVVVAACVAADVF